MYRSTTYRSLDNLPREKPPQLLDEIDRISRGRLAKNTSAVAIIDMVCCVYVLRYVPLYTRDFYATSWCNCKQDDNDV